MADCGHGNEKLVMNRCWWLWVPLLRFGSFCSNFSYLFFIAVKIHTMARMVKKQNNFIFSSLIT